MEYTEQNPLRLIELFAGIGSQTQALKNIGVKHKVVAISEIDKYAIQSYTAIHGETLNLGDICKIAALPDADLWTYSFPCQDISVAGKGAGIKVGTRSGLLYEVERLLNMANENGNLPKYLLLENVKNLVGKKFKADFDSWLSFLSSLGYSNYWKIMNAKDYGIPQNRERVFCVSIRGEHKPFVFPEKEELKLRLKDMVDDEVEEKYYLKESTIKSILHSNFHSRRNCIRKGEGVANTLCARDWKEPQCVQVGELFGGKWEHLYKMNRRVFETNGISPTLHCCGGGNTETKILADGPVIAAMRGRNPDNPGDRTKGIPLEQRLEINEKGVSNALTTVQKDNLVVEKEDYVARRYREFIEEKGHLPEMFVVYNKQEIKDLAPTLTGQCSSASGSSAVLKLEKPIEVNVATKQGYEEAEEGDYVNITYPGSKTKRGRVGKGMAHTITCGDGNAVITENVRIRKLTPRECLRLMGWKDEQIDKIQKAKISSTQQYRQAGNGIVVQVLENIFRALFLGENNE